jgi:hypothetical protein
MYRTDIFLSLLNWPTIKVSSKLLRMHEKPSAIVRDKVIIKRCYSLRVWGLISEHGISSFIHFVYLYNRQTSCVNGSLLKCCLQQRICSFWYIIVWMMIILRKALLLAIFRFITDLFTEFSRRDDIVWQRQCSADSPAGHVACEIYSQNCHSQSRFLFPSV